MAGFYHYSPWQDAANFGQGVGQSLGQALAQRPEIQARAREIQQQMQLRQQQGAREQQQFPLELQAKLAQIENYKNDQLWKQRQYELDQRHVAVEKQRADAYDRSVTAGEIRADKSRDYGDDSYGMSLDPSIDWDNKKRSPAKDMSDAKAGSRTLAESVADMPGVNPAIPVNVPPYVGRVFNRELHNPANAGMSQQDVASKFTVPQRDYDTPGWLQGGGFDMIRQLFGGEQSVSTTHPVTPGFRVPQELIDSFGVTHSGKVPNASLPNPNGAAAQTSQAPIKVDSEEAYNALPIGTVYMDSTGKQFTKR